MRCPACQGTLSEVTRSGVVVDVCDHGCGGIWFDNQELLKVDEAHESAGEVLLDVGPHKSLPTDRAAKRLCPRCPNQVMRRHFFSVRREIEIDACPACGGIWLDTQELAALRQEFKTEQERKRAADEYFAKLFNQELALQGAKDKTLLEESRKFAHALRFICPSYWIPGKQAGGAF